MTSNCPCVCSGPVTQCELLPLCGGVCTINVHHLDVRASLVSIDKHIGICRLC